MSPHDGRQREFYPQDNVVCYHIPAREQFAACKCTVHDHGDLKPEVMKEAEKKVGRPFGEFTLFVGDRGMIGSDGQLIPSADHDKFPPPESTLPRAHGGPIEDLYWCIRNGGTPASNFPDAAAPLTSIALAGHLAQFAGQGSKVEWDVGRCKTINCRIGRRTDWQSVLVFLDGLPIRPTTIRKLNS